GQTGFLVDPLDVDAIAAHMKRLLDDPELAAALGAQGRKHVRRWFLLPELARRHLVLARLLAGIDPAPPGFRLDAPALRPRGARG
ncbi:MAG: glycosyltransferase family 1 protein, partial [Candidatus Krumholzibacteria bacterium]|nr:glycosyltransferase family 1 protein [Candidatus Krumholzibacteria bacterium]